MLPILKGYLYHVKYLVQSQAHTDYSINDDDDDDDDKQHHNCKKEKEFQHFPNFHVLLC